MSQQFKAIVLHGEKLGRTIQFPTVNLDPKLVDQGMSRGVYSARVLHAGKRYSGALYFGPRLVVNETKDVLEIYILDFDQEIYDEEIIFEIGPFVRGILNFNSFDELKNQLQADVAKVRELPLAP